ncbi:MAG: sel1 repeat family protein, partial [Candidatus Methanomethylophilaceae archaeon]|nr:sel1 repeat family protein [Candidatus Methanomethylophilaceae archaeon]
MDSHSKDYDLSKAAQEAKSALSGNPDAKYLFSLFQYLGEGGIQKDKEAAKKGFSEAAESGSVEAGIVAKEFEKNPEDVMDGLISKRFLGEQRDTAACAELFAMYDKGNDKVKKSHAEAVRFYLTCAEEGDAEAQAKIGFMYLMGKGIPKDKELALKWLSKAADSGDGTAMYRIGQMYDQGLCNTDPDEKLAFKWYEKAAEAGNRDAQFALGCICMVPKKFHTDVKKAARLFEKAAEQGHSEAQYQIGMCYAYGQGVNRDPSLAVKWLEKSCESGYQQGMVDFANMCFEGQVIPKDLKKAAHWFTEAANRCNGYAQYALACMYGNGYYYEQSD